MTQKHTPGPWGVANSGGRVIRAGMVHPATIAVLETVPLKISDEIIANARLIAAAPELLAALEHLGPRLCYACDMQLPFISTNSHQHPRGGLISCDAAKARAAIAKAQGI